MSRLSLVRPKRLRDLEGSCRIEESKNWSSETDLHRLPPLSPSIPISPRLSRKGIHSQRGTRPPTPSPCRSPNIDANGKARLAPLSPTNSNPRLSLNLDLITLKEEITALEGRSHTGSQSPVERVALMDSPRIRVRSLPSSPRTTRRCQVKRLNSDPENCASHSKEERIVEWIRDVQRFDDTLENDDSSLEFSSISDSSDHDSSSYSLLPAIKENTILTDNSHQTTR